MKRIFQIFLFLLSVSAVVSEEVDLNSIYSDPTRLLSRILVQIPMQEYTLQSKDSLRNNIQNLAYAINQDILSSESKDWLAPSPLRNSTIKKWGNLLDRHVDPLVTLALQQETYRTGAGRQSRSLLDFAAPSKKFRKAVQPFLNGPKDVPLDSARLLFEHRMLTDEDKLLLSRRFEGLVEVSDKKQWAQSLSEMGMPDGLGLAKLILNEPPKSSDADNLMTQYTSALQVVGNLGPAAKDLLPDLERLISRIAPFAQGYMPHFEHARDVVIGKIKVNIPIAANGSGPLMANDDHGQTAGLKTPIHTTNYPQSNVPRNHIVTSPESKLTSKFSSWIWGSIALGLIIATILIASLARRNL